MVLLDTLSTRTGRCAPKQQKWLLHALYRPQKLEGSGKCCWAACCALFLRMGCLSEAPATAPCLKMLHCTTPWYSLLVDNLISYGALPEAVKLACHAGIPLSPLLI